MEGEKNISTEFFTFVLTSVADLCWSTLQLCYQTFFFLIVTIFISYCNISNCGELKSLNIVLLVSVIVLQ